MSAATPESRRLWLIGLMGSGKTTVGRRVAARWGCEYIDNDAAVAALAGTSTVEMSRHGGSELHDWEARYALGLGARPAPVVAGVPASCADRPEVLRSLRGSGLLIYLRCDVDTLAARVRADPPRPWFTGDPLPLLQRMYDQRDAVLAATATVIDASAAIETVAQRVLTTAGA